MTYTKAGSSSTEQNRGNQPTLYFVASELKPKIIQIILHFTIHFFSLFWVFCVFCVMHRRSTSTLQNDEMQNDPTSASWWFQDVALAACFSSLFFSVLNEAGLEQRGVPQPSSCMGLGHFRTTGRVLAHPMLAELIWVSSVLTLLLSHGPVLLFLPDGFPF